jgi:hypothetical protein
MPGQDNNSKPERGGWVQLARYGQLAFMFRRQPLPGG